MARSEWSFGSAAWLFHRAPHSWGGKALVLAVNHSYQGVRRVGALQIEEEGDQGNPHLVQRRGQSIQRKKKNKDEEELLCVIPSRDVRSPSHTAATLQYLSTNSE